MKCRHEPVRFFSVFVTILVNRLCKKDVIKIFGLVHKITAVIFNILVPQGCFCVLKFLKINESGFFYKLEIHNYKISSLRPHRASTTPHPPDYYTIVLLGHHTCMVRAVRWLQGTLAVIKPADSMK